MSGIPKGGSFIYKERVSPTSSDITSSDFNLTWGFMWNVDSITYYAYPFINSSSVYNVITIWVKSNVYFHLLLTLKRFNDLLQSMLLLLWITLLIVLLFFLNFLIGSFSVIFSNSTLFAVDNTSHHIALLT